MLAWAVVVAAVGVGCASQAPSPPSPPAVSGPAAGLGEFAGTWQGTISGPGFEGPFTQTIGPDGRYTAVLSFGTFTGRITVSDGVIRGKADQTGSTGTYSLLEEDGGRVLVYKSDDGMYGAKLRRAP